MLLAAMVVALVVGSGVALASHITNCTSSPCLGTDGEDVIQGTNASDTIKALAGDDLVKGFGGNDTIYGGRNGDGSAEGIDFLRFPGDERDITNLEGGEDSDTVYGGPGRDFIDAARNDRPLESPSTPVDRSFGGDGNEDIINCGAGPFDRAYLDVHDIDVRNCELNTGF